MSQNDISCKVEDQGLTNNPPSFQSIPNEPEKLNHEALKNIIPALYNYTLIEYFLGYVESLNSNRRGQELLQNQTNNSLQTLGLPPQNKNIRRDFDAPISPKKFLKLNTFDGEKVKLEDGSLSQETIQINSKGPLSEASTQEGSNNSSTSEIVSKNCPKEKNSQNPRKNLPGLVIQRIRTSCLTALENKNKPLCSEDEIRLKYIKVIFEKVNKEEIVIFQEYFKTLNKNWKTWKKVHDYIHGNEIFSRFLQKVIEGFLSEEGTIDFSHWLNVGKMNKGTREVIEKSKEWLGVKYKEVFKEKTVISTSTE